MKILIYIKDLTRGGCQRVVSNIANKFSDEGYQVTVVTERILNNEYELHNSIKRFNLGYLPGKKRQFIFKYKKTREILKNEKPNIILAFTPLTYLKIMMANLLLGFPIMISQRVDPTVNAKNFPIDKIIFKFLYPLADGCIFQTKEAQDYFPEALKKKSKIINNLVDNRFFEAKRQGERKNIIAVGRLHSQKNWDVAIKAFSMVADKIQDNLIIYGKGGEHGRLEELIAKLNLSDRIILAGVTDEVEKVVVNAKLFVLSSEYEGVPNALIEALVMGVPCVSTKFSGGGAEMLIESGVNGILVPKCDSRALADAMLKILTDSEYAEKLGQAAKERSDRFWPEIVFEQWEDYIVSLAKNHTEDKKSENKQI